MGGAFGAFGPVMGLAAVGGPILAGWLVAADLLGTGWRMIFLINVPLGVVGLIGALRFFPESRVAERARGSTRSASADQPPRRSASSTRWCRAASWAGRCGPSRCWPPASRCSARSRLVERRGTESPLIAPSLLRNRAFTSGLVVGDRALRRRSPACCWCCRSSSSSGCDFTPRTPASTFVPMSLGVAVGAGAARSRWSRASAAACCRPGIAGHRRGRSSALALTVAAHGGSDTTRVGRWCPALVVVRPRHGLRASAPLFNVILAGVDDARGRLGVGHAERGAAARQRGRRGAAGDDLLLAASTTATPRRRRCATTALISAGLFVPGLRALVPAAARGAAGGLLTSGAQRTRSAPA